MMRCVLWLWSGRFTSDMLQTLVFPLSTTLTHGPIRIGIIHGHQVVPNGDLDSLSSIARQMDVDVLVSGHTHASASPFSSILPYI